MTHNILIHSLRYSDLLYVYTEGKYKESMVFQFWNELVSTNPNLTFQKVLFHLQFNKSMIQNIFESEVKYRSNKVNFELKLPSESIQFAEFKENIKNRFENDFKAEIDIYGPSLKEINELENLIKFGSKNEQIDNKSINKYIIYGTSGKIENLVITNIKDVKGKIWDPNYDGVIWDNINVVYNEIFYEKTSFLHYPTYNDFFSSKGELSRQIRIEQLKPRLSNISKAFDEIPKEFNSIITGNSDMINLIKKAKYYSGNDENILITGESGTGKELFAEAIHNASKRSEKEDSYKALNCATISQGLAESELFGHIKGAFTDAHTDKKGYLELADKGTLFLDEIGELEIEVQAKLLRALEKKEFSRKGDTTIIKSDFRLISATNKDIKNENLFREDLYSRISTLTIEILPLKERGKDDIIKLSEYFLEILFRDKNKFYLTPDAQNLICAHDWPLNVRQLRNFFKKVLYDIMYRLQSDEIYIEYDGSVKIDGKDIGEILKKEKTKNPTLSEISNYAGKNDKQYVSSQNDELNMDDLNRIGNLDNYLEEIKKKYLLSAIKICKNQDEICKLLGYKQSRLSNTLKKLGVDYSAVNKDTKKLKS